MRPLRWAVEVSGAVTGRGDGLSSSLRSVTRVSWRRLRDQSEMWARGEGLGVGASGGKRGWEALGEAEAG